MTTTQRSPWPFMIALGLMIVVLVNMTVIWISLKNAPELVSENYYEDALNYDPATQTSSPQ